MIDKLTRTQCQKCRFDKCLAVGMTPPTGMISKLLIQTCHIVTFDCMLYCTLCYAVMNENQLAQRRQLRQENHQRRNQQPIMPNTQEMYHQQLMPMMPPVVEPPINQLLDPIVHAYRNAFRRCGYSRVTYLSILLLYLIGVHFLLMFTSRAHNSLSMLVMLPHSLLFIWPTCSHRLSGKSSSLPKPFLDSAK